MLAYLQDWDPADDEEDDATSTTRCSEKSMPESEEELDGPRGQQADAEPEATRWGKTS